MRHQLSREKTQLRTWSTTHRYEKDLCADLLQIQDSTLALVEKTRKYGISRK